MTSSEIRQSFLDFFRSKKHTIVPSSSLMPDAPNLLFTNAGMNQFVPIFLGQVKCPYSPARAADTQKCIRAGGKHNDLEDVGLDTYHHTFFEMLGNWSFGDYFKREAIDWAWELVVQTWGFPAERIYGTVFCPYLGEPGWEKKWATELEQVLALAMTTSEFIPPNPNASPFEIADQEAALYWAKKFSAARLDPKIHIVPGNKKDNFWMMGETGPCGPCSEIHVDLTAAGNTRGMLVNKGDARCIEIWNLVFIQFNANADGTFAPLPARHVDTGMGFERVTSIIQGTKEFKDFAHAKISNYETDIFRPIFDALEKLCGKKYGSTLPTAKRLVKDGDEDKEVPAAANEDEAKDVAFRVIGDHIRTLSFAIADGIQPGNKERNAVVRRILRRAAMFGRSLGFHQPFLYKLVDVLTNTMGDVFPEIRAQKKPIQDVIRAEEEAFNKTLDRGIELFEEAVQQTDSLQAGISGEVAFSLHATYGLPIEEVVRLAQERGLTVDMETFKALNEEHKVVSGAGQVREVIELSQTGSHPPTKFIGYDTLEAPATVLEIVSVKEKIAVITDTSAYYAEMGGQVGDTGHFWPAKGQIDGTNTFEIINTQKSGNTWLHLLEPIGEGQVLPSVGDEIILGVKSHRRRAIERHHTVTHLLHWALHEVVSREASQKGSFVGPEKLTFDFNSAPLTPQQVADVEKLVNERIVENAPVTWVPDVPYSEVKSRKDIMQFFGDKYGETVRVVQIGGEAGQLNGYSMELCGGTHTRATGEIGLFRITGENAIAAGVRRIEAVAGLTAYDLTKSERELIKTVAGKVNSPVHELEKKIEAMLAQQKELEKQVQIALERNASNAASELVGRATTVNGIPLITHNLGDADANFLQAIADALKGRFRGVVVLGGGEGAVSLVATVSPEFTSKVQAGKLIQAIAPVVGGKGGGKPDNARGGGKDASKLDEALAKVKSLLG